MRVIGLSSHLQPCYSDNNFSPVFFFFFQNLRAQEAAQAEAEDREDLEIAAEAAGIHLHQTSQAACQCA